MAEFNSMRDGDLLGSSNIVVVMLANITLDASKMNIKPGRKQGKRRDTVEQKVQKMNFELGVPKVLYEAYCAKERS